MRTVYFAPARRADCRGDRRAVADVVAVAADRLQAGDALAAREADAGVDGAARGAREAVGGELEGRVVGVDLDHRRLAAEAGAVVGGGVGRGRRERGGREEGGGEGGAAEHGGPRSSERGRGVEYLHFTAIRHHVRAT